MNVNMIVHGIGEGKDALTGKDGKGLTATINGKQRFLSWKSLQQLLSMELSGGEEKEPESPLFNRVHAGNHDEE